MEKNKCIEWLESVGFEQENESRLWLNKKAGIGCALSPNNKTWDAYLFGPQERPYTGQHKTAKKAIDAALEASRTEAYQYLDRIEKADQFMSRLAIHTPEEIAWLEANGYKYDQYYKNWWKNSGGDNDSSLPAIYLEKEHDLWKIHYQGYKDNHRLQTIQEAQTLAHQLYKQQLIDKISSTREKLENFKEAIGEQ